MCTDLITLLGSFCFSHPLCCIDFSLSHRCNISQHFHARRNFIVNGGDNNDDDWGRWMMKKKMMMMLAHAWRPPRGGGWVQRDSALKLIVIDFTEIQNWSRCWWPVANCPTRPLQWKAGSMAHATVLPSNRLNYLF